MATTYTDTTADGSNKVFEFGFVRLKDADVKVQVNQIQVPSTQYAVSDGPTKITFNDNNPNAAIQVTATGSDKGAPLSGLTVRVYRDTDVDTGRAVFAAGSSIRASDLNNNQDQALFAAQEQQSLPISRWQIQNDAIDGTKIADESIDSDHYVDLSIDTAHIANLQVTRGKIADDAIDGSKIDDNAIDSEHYAADSIDNEHYAPGSITNTEINNSANIAVSKLQAGSARQLLQTSSGTATEWASNIDIPGTLAVTGAVTLDSSLGVSGAITGNVAGNVTGNVTGSSGSCTGNSATATEATNITAVANNTANETVYPTFVDGATGTQGIETDTGLTYNPSTGTLTTTTVVGNVTGNVTGNTSGSSGSCTGNAATATDLAAATKITASEQAAHTANDTTYFTTSAADARYFNISTGDTIKDGQTFPDNDTTIATTAAINDRIIDLVDDVGGFVPIANETSFPTANPDVNNGAGTLVSIKALANNLVSNGSGVATISNGAGTGNTVTINGLANSTTYAATFGMIVETTSTLHTYAFHRLVPKATEVTTVSGSIANVNTVAAAIGNVNSVSTNATNVNTVAGSIANVNTVGGAIANVNTVATNINGVHHYADVYQVSTSAPTTRSDSSALSAGDMWFDSSSNKELRVHNGTAYQLVTPSQSVLDDIAIVSGNITFAEDLGLITASLTTGTGNSIETCADSISNIQTCHTNIANINTTAGAIANVNTVGGAIANVNTVGGSIADVNRYANEYKIASSNPGSPSAGDLWYNSTGNTLNYYNGSSWIGISPGINAVISDTTPELGGHLDCNDKNLTEVATISGTNLQIDFGTI